MRILRADGFGDFAARAYASGQRRARRAAAFAGRRIAMKWRSRRGGALLALRGVREVGHEPARRSQKLSIPVARADHLNPER
jgi:hypothetical protein